MSMHLKQIISGHVASFDDQRQSNSRSDQEERVWILQMIDFQRTKESRAFRKVTSIFDLRCDRSHIILNRAYLQNCGCWDLAR